MQPSFLVRNRADSDRLEIVCKVRSGPDRDGGDGDGGLLGLTGLVTSDGRPFHYLGRLKQRSTT